MTIEQALFQVGISLFTIITTALLTIWLGLRRFYREKWWEAKMRAYTDVIQALHHMNRDLDISIDAEIAGRDIETDYHKEWSKKHRAAWDEIRRQIDIGEFLYSPASMKVLQALHEETDSEQDSYFDHLQVLQSAVLKCLPAIKATARADLGLPRIR